MTSDKLFWQEQFRLAHNRLLLAIPDEEALPEHFSPSFVRRMNRLLRQQRRSPAVRQIVLYAKRAAIVFLTFITISFATVMSVEAYRQRFYQIVSEWFLRYTRIQVHTMPGDPPGAMVILLPTYLPPGMEQTELIDGEIAVKVFYRNAEEQELIYLQNQLSNNTILLNTEDAIVYNKEIEGQVVYYFTSNGGTNTCYWNDEQYFYRLIGPVTQQEIQKVAESIILQK